MENTAEMIEASIMINSFFLLGRVFGFNVTAMPDIEETK